MEAKISLRLSVHVAISYIRTSALGNNQRKNKLITDLKALNVYTTANGEASSMSAKRTAGEASIDRESQKPHKKRLPSNLNFSKSASRSKHSKSSNIVYNGHPDTLPKLPEILDKSLADVPFTHQGVLTGNVIEEVNVSYDRLEFLGDAYIELIATRVIFPRYPRYSAGKLSQTRQSLVNNETLAGFSLAYGFDTRARLPRSLRLAKDNRDLAKGWTKTMGDIFEAYVAAIILSDPVNGFPTAEAWLTELWSPMLSSGEDESLNSNAKVHLAAKLLGKGVKIAYLDEADPDMFKKTGTIVFHIGAYLTGWGWENAHLGSGSGLNKSEAGIRAAMEALSNPLTANIAAVKREFDIKVQKERQSQISPDPQPKAS